MKLGCQTTPTNEQHIRYLARYGVQAICGFPQTPPDRLYATVDELKAMREMAEKSGVTVDLVAPRFWPRSASTAISCHHAGAESRAGPGDRNAPDLRSVPVVDRFGRRMVALAAAGRDRLPAGENRALREQLGDSRLRLADNQRRRLSAKAKGSDNAFFRKSRRSSRQKRFCDGIGG
jgi:hypothetical protein